MLKEFCAENMERLHLLPGTGVKRVELCDNMAVGGTTPSYGVIKEACAYLHEHQMTVATMIRPRGGNFVYNDLELRIMEEDILRAVELGSDYLVLGILTVDNQLDKEALEQLLPATQGVPLVFHMAFDEIPQSDQFQAIDDLVDLGFARILLHGSVPRRDIMDNAAHISQLVQHAGNRIEIMVGGGVTAANAEAIRQATGAQAVHGTKIVALG